MKKMITLLASLLLVSFINGCGSDSTTDTTSGGGGTHNADTFSEGTESGTYVEGTLNIDTTEYKSMVVVHNASKTITFTFDDHALEAFVQETSAGTLLDQANYSMGQVVHPTSSGYTYTLTLIPGTQINPPGVSSPNQIVFDTMLDRIKTRDDVTVDGVSFEVNAVIITQTY